MALGAFLAGLLLAESPFRTQLEADIQPFRGLLLGLFFTTVGMSIDLGMLWAKLDQVLLLLVGLLVIKTALIWLLCRLFRMGSRISLQVGMSLAQGGEFAFVLFGLAGQVDLLPQDLLQVLLPAIALSMALTPFLLMAAGRLGQSTSSDKGSIEPDTEIEAEVASDEQAPVLILGFGRVGQTIAAVLDHEHHPYVALDLAPKRVAVARRKGQSVFYGSGIRQDVLRASGVRHAKAVVITLDDLQAAEESLEAVRREAPNVPVFVRARDHVHSRLLMASGANDAVPELLEASLQLGGMVLRSLQHSDDQVTHTIADMRHLAGEMMRDFIPEFPDAEDEEKI